MTLRIGVIGAGTHGARYMRHIAADVPGLRLAAACRRDAPALEALCAELSCRPHTEAAELATSPEVDAVVIATPPSTHHLLTVAALDAGKSVLVEKPMTGTLAEAVELASLASRPGTPALMVAQTLRWNPVLLKARELWSSLGRVRYLRLSQRLEPTTLPWQRRLAETVGGSVLLTGVHLFDTVRFMTGLEFALVNAKLESFANPVVEDFFLAHARLDDGTHVSLEVSKYGSFRGCLLEAVGDDGQLLADYYCGGLKVNRGRKTETLAVDATNPTLPAMLADWRDGLLAGAAPAVTAVDGLRTLEMTEACYASHRTGRPAPVGSTHD